MFTDYGIWERTPDGELPDRVKGIPNSIAYRNGDLDAYDAIESGHFLGDCFFRVVDDKVEVASCDIQAVRGVGRIIGYSGADSPMALFDEWMAKPAPENLVIWDGAEIRKIRPDELPAPEPRRVGKPREFLGLFTADEKTAFFAAKSQSVELEIWWAEASTGDFSLDHPSVAVGLSALVQNGILTDARKAEILATDFDAA